MLWIILGFSIASVLAVIIVAVISSRKRTEYRKIYTAAGNILREDYLNYALQNHVVDPSLRQPEGRKRMICIRTVQKKKKISYVFDPEKGILIGRDAEASNIFVDNPAVSQNHCRICAQNGQIVLEDLYSTNGTVLKRGRFQRWTIRDGYSVGLCSGDVLYIGNSELRVLIFDYDITMM